MISFDDFFSHLSRTTMAHHAPHFQALLDKYYFNHHHGDRAYWQAGLDALPDIESVTTSLDQNTVTLGGCALEGQEREAFITALKHLHPWRKGPFELFGVHIDTEWRSDWKWQRVAPHISDLKDRYVLDVGCGSGYHCWRMRGAGAKLVLGIDPSPKFLFQFQALKKYMPDEPVYYLPCKSEDMPANMQSFDTVFSMGVLYHRPSPFEHINELKQALKPGGEMVLETLTVDGGENTVLVPNDRYAQMRNVWFLPSPATLCQWLERIGLEDIRIVDSNVTSIEEQRQTDWMNFHSLKDFLDPNDPSKTIEGLPAPIRTTVVARKAQ